jgi:hypothetical protein
VNERDHAEDLGIDGRILQWILRKLTGKVWTGFIVTGWYKWWVVVNTTQSFSFHKLQGTLSLAANTQLLTKRFFFPPLSLLVIWLVHTSVW